MTPQHPMFPIACSVFKIATVDSNNLMKLRHSERHSVHFTNHNSSIEPLVRITRSSVQSRILIQHELMRRIYYVFVMMKTVVACIQQHNWLVPNLMWSHCSSHRLSCMTLMHLPRRLHPMRRIAPSRNFANDSNGLMM